MNRENAVALLPIIKAFSEGAVIEHCSVADNIGWRIVESPAFMDPPQSYRIKPKPRKVYLYGIPGDIKVPSVYFQAMNFGDPAYRLLAEVELPE